MKAEDLAHSKKLYFEMEDWQETMNVLSYQELKELSYTWDTATVRFQLEKINEQQTQLSFYEELPESFSHPAKDISGWLLQLDRLKKVLEKQPYEFNQKTFDKILEQVTQELEE